MLLCPECHGTDRVVITGRQAQAAAEKVMHVSSKGAAVLLLLDHAGHRVSACWVSSWLSLMSLTHKGCCFPLVGVGSTGSSCSPGRLQLQCD